MLALDLGGNALPIGLGGYIQGLDAVAGLEIGGDDRAAGGFHRTGHSAADGAGRARDENDFAAQIGHGSSYPLTSPLAPTIFLRRGALRMRPTISDRDLAMADTGNTDVKKLPFERAIEELESIVKRLEEGKVPLEESVAIYERGEVLKKRCEELLRQAEARVEKITLDSAGKPTGSEPLDVD